MVPYAAHSWHKHNVEKQESVFLVLIVMRNRTEQHLRARQLFLSVLEANRVRRESFFPLTYSSVDIID